MWKLQQQDHWSLSIRLSLLSSRSCACNESRRGSIETRNPASDAVRESNKSFTGVCAVFLFPGRLFRRARNSRGLIYLGIYLTINETRCGVGRSFVRPPPSAAPWKNASVRLICWIVTNIIQACTPPLNNIWSLLFGEQWTWLLNGGRVKTK